MSNILVITYWNYNDALIQTYTLPYVRIIKKILPPGSKIYLGTLEREGLNPISKSAIRETLERDDIQWLPFAYHPFGINGFFMWVGIIPKLTGLILSKKITAIHCWGPMAGAIGYLLSLFTGRKLIIDSYEPHAESMVENGTWKKDSLAFKLLFWLERKQTKRAFAVIGATEGMRDYAKKKYGTVPRNFFVKPACVDIDLFSRDKIKKINLLRELDLLDKTVCVYAGKLGGIYLEQETFEFFKIAHEFWGDRFRVVLLSSHTMKEVTNYCSITGLDLAIITLKFVPHSDVADYMGLGDFAITPVKPVPTKRYCTPVKDGEYWALGLPVVIPPQISDDSDIIQSNNAGAILTGFERNDYLSAVRKIDELLKEERSQRFSRINGLAHRYRSFGVAVRVYNDVYGKGF